MRTRLRAHTLRWLVLMCAAPLVLACGLGGTTVKPAATAVAPSPTSTPAPPPHAIAWVKGDASGVPQVWASINDGPPTQITHQGPFTQCQGAFLGSPMFSPDLTHIAVAAGIGCNDGQISGPLLIVTVSSGTVTHVPLPTSGNGILTDERSYGWIDNSHVFALGTFNAGPGGVEYALGAAATTPLPGMSHPVEGVVRGSTLFYSEVDYSGAGLRQIHTYLHRYDLTTHATMSGSIDLGGILGPAGSPLDLHYQGWDASPDGTHVVYQVTTPLAPTGEASGISSQAIYYANADGSGASHIVQYMNTLGGVRMRISPDGKLVAITNAVGTPDVLSGCVGSPGKKGDPCLQFYSPDALDYPAWSWNSASLIATTGTNIGTFVAGPTGNGLERYTPGKYTGTSYATAGYNPWSTP